MAIVAILLATSAKAGEPAPRHAANGMNSVLRAPNIHAVAYQKPPSAQTPAQVRGLHWTFRDVEINTLLDRLKRFGVDVPVPVAGQVTARLSAGVPSLRSIFRTTAYQVEAQIESDKLSVAGFELHRLTARMVYHNGTLQLTSLRFSVSRPGGGDGIVSGSARVQVRPRGDLTANVSLEQIPLSELADVIPQLAGMISGDAGGHVTAQVPLDKLRDLTAWRGEAHLTLEKVAVPHLPHAELVADVRLAAGQTNLSHLSIEMGRLKLTGGGALALSAPFEFTAQLRFNAPDLAWLTTLEPEFRPPVDVAGQLTANAAVSGKLQSREFRLRGALVGSKLKAGPIDVERMHVPFDVTADVLRLDPIQISIYGGQVGATLRVPFDRQGTAEFGMQWRDLDLGELAADFVEAPAAGASAPRQGQSSGNLQVRAPLDRLQDTTSWTGQGQLSLRDAAAQGVAVPQASLGLQIADGALRIPQISIRSSLAQVTGSARLKLQTPFDFGASLSIANIDLAQANRLPDGLRPPLRVAGRAGVSADLRGTLQPLTFAARGAVAVRRLQAGRAVLDRVDLNYDVDDQKASLSQLVVAGYQGRLTGSVTAPLAEMGAAQVKLAWQTMNVARLLADLDVLAPLRGARVEGWSNGSIDATADGRLTDLNSWQVQSDMLLWALRLDAFTLRRAALTAQLADGTLKLSKIEADEGPLRLNASAHVALLDAKDFGATVRLRRADLALLNRLPPGLRPPVAIVGTANVSADVGGTLDPPQLTRGDVDASLASLSAFGWTGASARFTSRVRDGVLEITQLSARQGGTTVNGSAQLGLAAPFDYQAKLTVKDVDLARANTLPEALRPPVKLAGFVGLVLSARGTLDPLLVTGDGSLAARNLEADGAKIDRVALDFATEKEQVSVSRLLVELYEGQIQGSATLPLDDQVAGRVAIAWSQIDIGRLATDVARPPAPLTGRIDGNIEAKIPAGKLAQIAAWNVDASFDAPQLTAEAVTIGSLRGKLAYQQGVAQYEVSGEALLGRLLLAGVWQPSPPGDRPGQNEGSFQLTDARLATLAPLLRERGAADTLSGTLSVSIKYHHDPETGQPLGSGNLELDDVQYQGIALADEVRGEIRVLPGQMEMANVAGVVAGGQLLGSATVFLQPGRRSTFTLTINGTEVADIVSLWPQLARQVRGTVDAQVRGFFGMRRPVYVNGAAAIRQGHFDGIEFSGARAPISGVLDLGSGTGQLHLHGTTAQVALGRVVGDFDLTLTSMGVDLNGKGKFSRVDLRTLLRHMASARRLGSGKISGKFTLAGRNVRTVRDLTGTVDADLTNAQAMSFPVLQGVLPYLTGGISGSTTFNQGDVRARLAGGVVRVDEFSLSSNLAQLYARGTVTVSGRLNLNVTVNTGQLNPSARAVSLLAARIALFTAPPVALLLEASQFLSNQVINVEVTGTVRSPTVRIRPLPLLEQEVIQFFLLQAPGV